MEKINKRLIGKEDIAFDYDGNNSKDSYSTGEGNVINLKKINAGDLPITIEARQKIAGAENVDQAICIIADSLGDNIVSSKLTEDTTVVFSKNDTQKTMQDKINAVVKDLGWHTLTFKFPIEVEHILPFALVLEGFYHGNIVITSEGNGKATVKDQTGCDALFLIRNCAATWEVNNLDLQHNFCLAAIVAKNSAPGNVTGCSFLGHGSYALQLDSTFAVANNNTYSNDAVYLLKGYYSEGLKLSAPGTRLGVAGSQDVYFSSLATFDQTGKFLSVIQTAMYKNTSEPVLRFYVKKADGTEGEKITLYSGYVDLPATVRLSSGIIKSKSATERLAIYGGTTSKDGAYLSLRGNANAAGTAGEFILATSEVNNNAKVLRGKPDGSLTWLDKDITLGYPNYAAGVDLGSRSSYTATSDGWVFATGRRDGTYWNLRVGGARVFVTGGSSWDAGSCLIPIKKGDVVKTYDGQDEATTAFAVNMVFYPNR